MKGTKKAELQEIEEKVELHYSPENLLDTILTALNSAGKNINEIQLEDLGPVEDFHFRGREATKELINVLSPDENTSVLDIGCGIGGTCRFIASEYRSKVTGVDLSAEFIYTAEELTIMVGLVDRIEFYKGSATDLPFDSNHFDMAISQHINMNIREKEKYISEVNRILNTSGKFGIYEIFRSGYEDIKYPVPWAEDEQISYLTQWNNFEKLLVKNGFKESYKNDTTQAGFEWIKGIMEKTREQGVPGLSPQVFMGSNAEDKFRNLLINIQENKLILIQAVYIKS